MPRARRLPPRPRPAVIGLAAILVAGGGGLVGMIGGVRSTPPGSPPGASSAPGPVAGETYLWRPVAIGGGGFVTGMATDRTGATRLIQTDVHGGYRWDDGIARWVPLVTARSMPPPASIQNGMNEGLFAVAVAPGDARRAYMAIKGRVYRSDDGGRRWTAPAADDRPFPLRFDANGPFRHSGPFLAVDPRAPDTVLFGTPQDGLLRSLDAGVHWSHVAEVPSGVAMQPPPGRDGIGVVVWFAADGRAFAASAGHGVFEATSAAGRFAPIGGGRGGPLFVSSVATAPDGALYAIETGDRAAWRYAAGRWQRLDGFGTLPSVRFAGVAADPRRRRLIVSDEGGRVWCSTDGGGRFDPMTRTVRAGAGDPPWLRLNDQSYFASGRIAFDPVVDGRLWVDAGTGPYAADLGPGCEMVTWRSRVRGIEELVANDVVQPPGHAPLFAGWDFGIHQKPDLDAFSTTFGPKPRLLIAAQQLDWTPSDPVFVVTNASDTRLDCCSQDGDSVLAGYSEDGGATWRKFATLPQPPGTRPGDPWRMSFGTIAVAAENRDNIVWAPAFDRSPFYTLDRGRTWSRVVLPGEILPLTGSYEHLYGGRKTLAADRVTPATFYLYHSGDGANGALQGLWRTIDGGRRWQEVFAGEIAPDSRGPARLRAVPGQAGNLFFTSGVSGRRDTALRRSRDGGATWTAVADVSDVDDVGFGKAAPHASYPTIFVSGRIGGRYGLWRSIDDARSWSRLAAFPADRLDQVTAVEGDKDVFGRVYVGYMGSGWLYGEPAACRAGAPYRSGDRSCDAVMPAAVPAAATPAAGRRRRSGQAAL